ncbi:hypothetical protein JCM11641_005770 [Rhodosporidiobolus odoratus]
MGGNKKHHEKTHPATKENGDVTTNGISVSKAVLTNGDTFAANGIGKPAAKEGIADSNYARKRRELVTLIDQLRSYGASSEIDLPRIAVIGNQSVGKSSFRLY